VDLKEKAITAYQNYNDRELISLVNNGNEIAEYYLINKYKRVVKIKARAYFLIGADTDDVIQEGMIGLYKAVRSYDNSKSASFRAFAEICINRQIITAIKAASRKKHIPLNYYLSLNQQIDSIENSDRTLLDIVDDLNLTDPMNIFLNRESLQELKKRLNDILSNLERKILKTYLEGKTYQEIALEIDKSTKSVDNGMQRIKKKLDLLRKLD
jgi:RNA polymerase sporulation-specific sigma factor